MECDISSNGSFLTQKASGAGQNKWELIEVKAAITFAVLLVQRCHFLSQLNDSRLMIQRQSSYTLHTLSCPIDKLGTAEVPGK